MRKKIAPLIISLIIICFTSCNCSFWGAYDLGSKITLLEGDKEDRIIIYCTTENGCCDAGVPIIPSREDTITSYIEKTDFNNNWVIAKGINKDKTNSYWIIDKNFKVEFKLDDGGKLYDTIQSHVTGPLDYQTFSEKIKELNIDLELE